MTQIKLPPLHPVWPCLSCVVNHSRKVVANSQRPTLACRDRECSAFLKEERRRPNSKADDRGQTQKRLKCVKDNSKEKKTLWPGVFFPSEGIFLESHDWTCQPCRCVALLSSVVGHMLFVVDSETQTTAYFVCTTKRLRLGSPFLFSQWKGEIDGYHLQSIALFERYPTFHRHHWIPSWANKPTRCFILSSICFLLSVRA